MNKRRVLAIAKLVILFGTPVAFVVGLFSCGVYCGVQHREGITTFERDWLGLDVEVPAREKADTASSKPDPKAEPDPKPDPKAEPDSKPDPKAEPEPTPKAEPAPKAEPRPEPDPESTLPVEREPDPAPVATPETRPDPLEGELATRLSMPVRVRVKVLVDDEVIAEHPDWIDYVQRVVASASQVYEKQFGISLELTSVGRWSVTTAGLDSEQLLDDVRARPREGNDVLLGFTNRPFDDRTAGKAETPTPESAYNGAYGVIYARPGHHQAHLRTLLHELGHVFGALDITDPSDPAWVAKSFMSYAPARESDVPWIDAANRKRILERKDLPFVAEAALEGEEE
jgi:hypothetical protein